MLSFNDCQFEKHWDLYKNIKAIYTLVPALLGLKGNLEMTLASRLSTQVKLELFFKFAILTII